MMASRPPADAPIPTIGNPFTLDAGLASVTLETALPEIACGEEDFFLLFTTPTRWLT